MAGRCPGAQRTGQTLPRETAGYGQSISRHPSLNSDCYTRRQSELAPPLRSGLVFAKEIVPVLPAALAKLNLIWKG